MICAGTGHRPERIHKQDCYNLNNHCRLRDFIAENYLNVELGKPDKVISGMALGFDMALSAASTSLGIYTIAAIPFKGQENRWSSDWNKEFNRILNCCQEVVYVDQLLEYNPTSFEGYAGWKITKRDHYMIDRCDCVITMFDGVKKGGTYTTLKYAKKQDKTIINLWTQWKLHETLCNI